jgi:hypothetical protein
MFIPMRLHLPVACLTRWLAVCLVLTAVMLACTVVFDAGFETLAPIRFGRVDIKYRQVSELKVVCGCDSHLRLSATA